MLRIEAVSTDSAYDHRHCYDEITAKGAKAVIPPRKDAVIWQHGMGLRSVKGVRNGNPLIQIAKLNSYEVEA